MLSAGVTGVILGVFHPSGRDTMRDVALNFLRGGVEVMGFYGLPYFGSNFGEHRDVDWAIANCQETGVRRVWVDAEIDAAPFGFTDNMGATTVRRVEAMERLVAKIDRAGLLPGIYSAPWWWKPNTGNYTGFKSLPLWFANYGRNDGTQAPLEVLPEPFGGWTRAAIHQFTSTMVICGRGRDANYVFQEDEVTQEDFNSLLLACFSGAEDRDNDGKTLPRDTRLVIARERMKLRADGHFGSVADRTESAIIIADEAKQNAGLVPHTHNLGPAIPS